MYTVYIHTTPEGKAYVGRTSQQPERRFQNGIGYKTQKRFWAAISYFGWENIKHEIVKTNLTREEANSLEQSLIEKLKANDPEYGYNVQIGGECTNKGLKWEYDRSVKMPQLFKQGQIPWNKGVKYTEEMCKKLSEVSGWKGKKQPKEMVMRRIEKTRLSNLGRHNSEEARQRMSDARKDKKAVVQYSKSGEFMSLFDSLCEAEKVTGIQKNHISRCCRGIQITAGGYLWKFKKEDINDDLVRSIG